jgi:glycosyltransferase involved in cell wall biosynthesis
MNAALDSDEEHMNAAPRLSIGLPVYNGEKYLAESLDALLGQTYRDFELIISDNASTDGTEQICREYEARDPRIRYIRQPVNIGCAPNHNLVFEQSGGELFKWASDDDLYARDLLQRCVEALDEHPDAVLCHSWTSIIDSDGNITRKVGYPLTTDSSDVSERFRSLLFDVGGDDDYGVVRADVLRRTALNESFYHADRTLVPEIALHGRFHHVPESLYFRRDHPDSAKRSNRTVRSWCRNLDPRRASRFRHPLVRLLAEYPLGYVRALVRAPLSTADRLRCFGQLGRWLISRAVRAALRQQDTPVEQTDEVVSVAAVVAGQGWRIA